MLLKQMKLQNFRGIQELSFFLDDLCVLIGENNSGKSSILDALRLCLTRSFTRHSTVFEEFDYHLDDPSAEPFTLKPIEITLTFAEEKEGEWPDEISQRLSEAEQIEGAEGLRSIVLRVNSSFDSVANDYVTDYDFLDLSGHPLVKAKSPRHLFSLQQLIPTFYLASSRDAAKEFRARSTFWGPFVRALSLDEATREELESTLQDLNNKVISQHVAFDSARERLKKTGELLRFDDANPVSIEALPSKASDILSRTQVNFNSKTGAQIPVVRHGGGTQSLAVICLFDAYLQSQLREQYDDYAEPLLILEEPEAHLHPSAIKAVGEMLQNLPGQKLIATHSGDLLAGIPLSKIRRLRQSKGKTSVHYLREGVLSADDLDKLDYHIRATRGAMLFSRCWLLVEGETEVPFIQKCAQVMGFDLYADGVSCIEFSQVGVEKFVKLADQLGIEWFVFVDNDTQGKKYKRSAEDHLDGRNPVDHVRLLDHGKMEVFLCMEGYGDIYEKTISRQKSGRIQSAKGTLKYWQEVVNAQESKNKTKNSLAVAQRIALNGPQGVPHLLQEVIRKARNLARRAN